MRFCIKLYSLYISLFEILYLSVFEYFLVSNIWGGGGLGTWSIFRVLNTRHEPDPLIIKKL